MIYFVIILFLLWLIYLYDYRKESRGRDLSFYLVLIIFIALAGLRYKVGGDTGIYMKYFEDVHELGRLNSGDFAKTRFGPGFVVIASALKTISEDYIFFQFVHAIIVNTVVFFFIRKNCRHVFFAILLFFNFLYFYLIFEQVRESFAVAIFLLAWPAFKNGKWIIWYIASVLAFTIHISAVVMLFVPLMCVPGIKQFFTFGKRTWFICLGVFILAFLLQTIFFRYIEVLAVTDAMQDRAEAYGDMQSEGKFNIGKIITSIIQFIAYPLIALYYINQQIKRAGSQEAKTVEKENMMVLMSVYISIASIFMGIFVRYNNYFFIFPIIVMGDWIFTKLTFLKKSVRMGYLYWIILFIPMFGINLYNVYLTPVNKSGTLKTYMLYYPYNSVLDPETDINREKTITYIHRHLL